MKKNLFCLISLSALFIALPCCAELTTSDTVSEDYLRSHGYSSAFINATQKSVSQANGEYTPTDYERKIFKKGIVRGVRRFFMYLDPAYDDKSFMNNHNIHTAPNIGDL